MTFRFSWEGVRVVVAGQPALLGVARPAFRRPRGVRWRWAPKIWVHGSATNAPTAGIVASSRGPDEVAGDEPRRGLGAGSARCGWARSRSRVQSPRGLAHQQAFGSLSSAAGGTAGSAGERFGRNARTEVSRFEARRIDGDGPRRRRRPARGVAHGERRDEIAGRGTAAGRFGAGSARAP